MAGGKIERWVFIMKIYSEFLGRTFDIESDEMKRLGTVELDGKTLYLIQDAYADNGCDGELIYRSAAIDENGEDYNVVWNAYNTDEENECYINSDGNPMGPWDDESNACDWSKYSITKN
jgi:hypothetical protein